MSTPAHHAPGASPAADDAKPHHFITQVIDQIILPAATRGAAPHTLPTHETKETA